MKWFMGGSGAREGRRPLNRTGIGAEMRHDSGRMVKSCGPGAVVFTPADIGGRFGPGSAFPRLYPAGGNGMAALFSSVVFPCVSALAFAVQGMRLWVAREKDGCRTRHELDRVFAAPTNGLERVFGDPALYVELSTGDMLARMITFAATGGVAYVEKIISGRRLAGFQVHPLGGVERDIRTGRVHSVLRADGSWDPVEHRDMIVLRWPVAHPEDDGIGMAPVEALARELGMDLYASTFIFDLLRDDGIPFQALKLPPGCSLDPTQRAAVKEEFARRMGKKGELAVLENGAEFDRPGISINELNLESIYRIPESRGPACFRVPAPIAGLAMGVEHSTYSNFAEARLAFTEGTVAPIAASWSSALDAGLRAEGWLRRNQRVVLGIAEPPAAPAAPTSAAENSEGGNSRSAVEPQDLPDAGSREASYGTGQQARHS
ncbi:MAG TPA: phage portal protein [Candidatus Kapabacteria bacterium]|nr:phage portal protein [Candidatus Kapabacteria bacterium]